MMDGVWKPVIILSVFIAAAQCLNCRQCPISLIDTCLFGSEVTCSNANESCYRGQAQFNATESVTLHIRGCLSSRLCGTTINSSLLGADFTSSFQCCTTDLCNGAASVQRPLILALCAAILSALRGLWEL
ncbi:protein Bouncer-like [Plectropomus leopardus]|uniref:protein Bouncer-like n=1 Tax=Plectropomus leopardus TaxID=160734 RepID=UPI001C4CB4F2|nr:protein Bouncer-like [Plectropomus leopardus]